MNTTLVKRNYKGLVFMLSASVLWSFGGLLVRFVPWGAMSIIGIRSIFAASLFSIFQKGKKIELTKGNVLSALCIFLTSSLLIFAYQYTTAAAAVLLHFTSPIFIILLLLIFYGKKPKPVEIIAVTATFLGIMFFFADSLETGKTIGNILAMCSGLAIAGLFICSKRLDTNLENSLMLGFLVCAVLWLPLGVRNITADPVAWLAVILLGIFQTGLGYLFFSFGVKRTPVLAACIITALEPVLNPIWVALFIAEVPGRYTVYGGVIILLTVVAFTIWTEKTRQKANDVCD